MKPIFKRFIISAIASISIPLLAQAQDVSVDYVSRYIWRGLDAGSSPSLQPTIEFSKGNFSFGTWGAVATNGNPAGTEINLYAAYSLGDLSISITDYFFPEADPFTDAATHYVELGLGYSIGDVSLSGGVFVLNDDDFPVYLEAGYTLGAVDLFLGFTPMESALYGNSGPAFINLGFGTSKEISITDSFSLPVSTSLILNPNSKSAFFVVGISF